MPGGLYWQLLASFQELSRARPAALRLCVLAHVLEAWKPNYRCAAKLPTWPLTSQHGAGSRWQVHVPG